MKILLFQIKRLLTWPPWATNSLSAIYSWLKGTMIFSVVKSCSKNKSNGKRVDLRALLLDCCVTSMRGWLIRAFTTSARAFVIISSTIPVLLLLKRSCICNRFCRKKLNAWGRGWGRQGKWTHREGQGLWMPTFSSSFDWDCKSYGIKLLKPMMVQYFSDGSSIGVVLDSDSPILLQQKVASHWEAMMVQYWHTVNYISKTISDL